MAHKKTNDILSDLKNNFLTCPVCLDYFKDPRFLPCGHKVCFSCIKGLSPNGRPFKCPTDRTVISVPNGGIEALPKDFACAGMLEKIEETNTLMCIHHERDKIILYCVPCEVDVCVQCITTQHQGHIFKAREEVWKDLVSDVKEKLEQIEKHRVPWVGILKTECKKEYESQGLRKDQDLVDIRERQEYLKKLIDEEAERHINAINGMFAQTGVQWKQIHDELVKKETDIKNATRSAKEICDAEIWSKNTEEIQLRRQSLICLQVFDQAEKLPNSKYNGYNRIQRSGESVRNKIRDLFGALKQSVKQIASKPKLPLQKTQEQEMQEMQDSIDMLYIPPPRHQEFKVKLCGLSTKTSSDLIKMYLDTIPGLLGDICLIELDPHKREAMVTFNDSRDAAAIVDTEDLEIDGCLLTATYCHGPVTQ